MIKYSFYLLGLSLILSCGSSKMSEKKSTKPGSDLVDKYWKLTEINGHKEGTVSGGKEAYIQFEKKELRVNGNGGCNTFSGSYTVSDGNKLQVSGIASTKMACMHHHHENEFFKLLAEIDSYTIRDDILSLNRGPYSAPLKFQLVPAK